MDRVAFLVDETGERIECLLNPETFEVKRSSGIRPQHARTERLVPKGLADDPLHFTGGGRTEAQLDLLFDTELIDGGSAGIDVRALTRPLWLLSENSTEQAGTLRPPLVRFVWGKGWNVPGVIAAIAERFDRFTAGGMPRRSWLRLRFLRVADDAAQAEEQFDEALSAAERKLTEPPEPGAPLPAVPPPAEGATIVAVGSGPELPGYSGVRFDLLATDGLGSPFLWRLLAQHNRVDNPHTVSAGAVLDLPEVSTKGRLA